jgi:hypothetical protein
MGSLREAARDRDWHGGLGLAGSRLGSVEFVVMIYRNQPRYRGPSRVYSTGEGRPKDHGKWRARLLSQHNPA